MRTASNLPGPKVIGAAISALVVYLIAQVGLELPEEITAALVLLISSVVGYFLPAQPTNTIDPSNEEHDLHEVSGA